MSVTLNGLQARSCKIFIPWKGAWVADLELVLDSVNQLPSGKVTLAVGDSILLGTIDPRSSGSFATRVWARVVGGAGAWDSPVTPQHFHNPAGGLLSTTVYTATAALVGETVSDPSPVPMGATGQDYARPGGAAMRVFQDRDWRIDPATGITVVAAWPSAQLNKDAVLVDYLPGDNVAHLHSDVLIVPGTVLAGDERLNGVTLVVRDVEHTFDESGTSVTAWVTPDTSVSLLSSALTAMVREFAGTAALTTYLYRFVLPAGSDMTLQAITPGAPDLNPISQWTGMSGVAAKIAPATVIVVGFAGRDFANPYIVSYSPLATPLEVDIAGGASYLTPAPWAIAMAAALQTFAVALAVAGVGPLAPLVGVANTLLASLATLPPPATVLTKAT